jgi:uncharacterized membrane protein
MNIIAQAIIAGVFFGLWPLFMQRSGLEPKMGSMAFALIGTLCISLFTLSQINFAATKWDFPGVKWHFIVCAGLSSAIGVLVFTAVLAKCTPQNVAIPFVIANIVQTIIPAIYSAIMNDWNVPAVRWWGFAAAILTTILLTIEVPTAKASAPAETASEPTK